MHVSIGHAAAVIGVAVSTLRRWEREGKFASSFRTLGKHRRYDLTQIERTFLGRKDSTARRRAVAYARVSSHDQKNDLKRQIHRLQRFCRKSKLQYQVISDLGSGINYNKRGLNQLLQALCSGEVSHLILTHRDRLLRFGSPLLFRLCQYYQTHVIILDEPKTRTFEEELVADVIEIMTVFTSKVYGRRSHSKKRAA